MGFIGFALFMGVYDFHNILAKTAALFGAAVFVFARVFPAVLT
jgi:hypothetical protein